MAVVVDTQVSSMAMCLKYEDSVRDIFMHKVHQGVCLGSTRPWWGEGSGLGRKKVNCSGYKTKASSEGELHGWRVAAPGEGGLLTWGNCYRGDSVESYQGNKCFCSEVGLGSAGRFHYRVEARNKEQVPLLPLTVSYLQQHASCVLLRSGVGVVVMGKTAELVYLIKDSL